MATHPVMWMEKICWVEVNSLQDTGLAQEGGLQGEGRLVFLPISLRPVFINDIREQEQA